jgi:hypothetical protein
VVAAPFVVLALALAGTACLAPVAREGLHDGFLDLGQFAPALLWGYFPLFAAVFLWFDELVVGWEQPRAWVTVGAMWRTTALAATGALLMSLFLTCVVGGVTIAAALAIAGAGSFTVVVPAAAAALAILAGRKNVRTRRAARIVPRPF